VYISKEADKNVKNSQKRV